MFLNEKTWKRFVKSFLNEQAWNTFNNCSDWEIWTLEELCVWDHCVLKYALLLFVQISTQIRRIQQCFVYRIKLIHEEKLTSLAANCATGCLQNELHIQLCVIELLGELSSAWDDYSARTSDLQRTGSRPASNEEDYCGQVLHHETWDYRIRFTLKKLKILSTFFLGWTYF